MAENYRPIHGRVPIIIKTCMVTRKIKARDVWISSPKKFFRIRSQVEFFMTHKTPVSFLGNMFPLINPSCQKVLVLISNSTHLLSPNGPEDILQIMKFGGWHH